MSTNIEYDKYLSLVKLYSMEEPTLDLIHSIKRDDFPDVGFGFASGDGMFNNGYILFLDRRPTQQEDDNLSALATNGNFVVACDNWESAKEMTLTYLKHESIFEDERFLPDDVSLN